MARQLSLVPAPPLGPAVLDHVWPALRAALDGGAPLAVLPAGDGPAAAARAALHPEEPLEDGVDLVVVTSGSTGTPRGVLLSADAVRASATATLDRLGGPGHWLLALPVSAIAGLQVLARSALAGTTPTVLPAGGTLTDAVAALPAGRRAAARRYTAVVPTQLRRALAAEPDALRSFDAVLVGGAAADPELLAAARDAGVAVVTTYGMSETAGGCVYDGVPLDGVAVRIVDGGVELHGPVLASGYRLDPAGTAEAFADGWFRTRDAGSFDGDGRRAGAPLDPVTADRLVVHGRLDDVVVSGGVNVSPQAVEAALRTHPAVADAVVAGLPDAEWGRRVVAAVVPAPGAVPELAALRAWVTGRLGAPAAPKELHLLAAVPVLHTGKPDRRAVARLIEGA